jgi:hypothetical protein
MRVRYYRKLESGSLERITKEDAERDQRYWIRLETPEEIQYIVLPQANVRLSSVFNSTPESRHDPTGMVKSPCEHGEYGHPVTGEPADQNKPLGKSWIRAKYLDVVVINRGEGGFTAQILCPVCKGEPAPEDLATPANHPRDPVVCFA